MRTHAKPAILLGCLILVATALLAQSDATHSGSAAGRWKLNTQKSDFGKMPAPKSASLVVSEDSADKVKWQMTGVDAQGKKFSESYDGPADGTEHAITGSQMAQAVAYTRGADNTVEANVKMKDGSTAHETITMSDDNNTMTLKGTASGANGESNWTEVFERAGGGKKMKAAAKK
jgi:hypothetical protein